MLRVAAIQFSTSDDREATLKRAEALIARAAGEGAKLCLLPEAFTGLYGVDKFAGNAELELGEASGSGMMSRAAAAHGIHVAGGVIEKDGEALYNTVFAYGPTGERAARYRKLHLSRVKVGGAATAEGTVLMPGDDLVVMEVGQFRVGILNCFDLRFQQAAFILSHELDCHALLYPSAWLATSGELGHWDCLLRARALDNGVYVVGCTVARNDDHSLPCYGGSCLIDPMGQEQARCQDNYADDVVIADWSMDKVEDVRQRLPLRSAARCEVFARYGKKRKIEDSVERGEKGEQ